MNKISVLLPTRGRTQALKRSLQSLVDLAVRPRNLEFMIGFDEDDNDSLDYFLQEIQPIFVHNEIDFKVLQFAPMGYIRLNEYVNELARRSTGQWFLFWNDDAYMVTKGWDCEINKWDNEFCVLRMPTHNQHPYAIFPIVPRIWLDLFGYLSAHQISDAWISQVAYLVDIMHNIDVEVVHDRHDLTGNNYDATFKTRPMLEGNQTDPRDFNHATWRGHRLRDATKISQYLAQQGKDITWITNVIKGHQDPWQKMMSAEFDPNKQLTVYKK